MRTPETAVSRYITDYTKAIGGSSYRRPLSEYTIRGYERSLRELDALLGHPTLADFTLDAVAKVVTAKRTQSPSNARLMAAVAKTFSRWLHKTDLTTTHRLEPLGVPTFNGKRRAFTDAEFRTILRAIEHFPNRTRKRDKAIVLLAIGSGLRSNEIRTLDRDDFHVGKPLSESWALIRWDLTKTQQERRVRVAEDAAAAIYDYQASDRDDSDGNLFLTERGFEYTYNGWSKMWANIADRLEEQGVKGFSAHRCRHQWATLAARDRTTQAELCQEGGWHPGSKVPSRYIDEIPFSEIQKRPSPMTAFLRRSA